MTTTISSPAIADDHRAIRAELLADLVARELVGTEPGHCVRVNFLGRAEAEAVCARLSGGSGNDALEAFVLVSAGDRTANPLDITADHAIERRNRKRGRLCLFVPSDLVDAAISSLGNSFAEFDARDLYRDALAGLSQGLPPVAADLVRRVRAELGPSTRAGDGEVLDLVLEANARAASGRLETLGLELWRVDLIADARPDFDLHLPANRRAARLLARPAKLDAPARDRVGSLKVSAVTARALERFFARRPMHDVGTWSRALIADRLTFDQRVFPEAVRTDLQSVAVKPYLDPKGEVLKTAKLLQPDGPGSPLLATIGEKQILTAGWATDPPKPINVHAWSVSLVPARESGPDGEDDLPELPGKEVKGTLRTTKLKLDLDLDELPETPFCVRVVALDETGNEVLGPDGEPVASRGDEFFLTREAVGPKGVTERRRTVPSLPEGRLRLAVEAKTPTIDLTEPRWAEGRGVTYFSARVDERNLLTVALSPLLLDLERRTLREPRTGGRWALALDELYVPPATEIVAAAPMLFEDGAWGEFWRARSGFFERLRKAEPRDVLEAADWTTELTNAAVRYGQSYTALLASIPAGSTEELRAALTVDTLLVRLDVAGEPEDAVVVLPTHPVRVAWLASHAALLRQWEEALLRRGRTERGKLVDRDLVRDLRPVNMPAFAVSWRDGTPFVFFQNLAFAHGVALPAGVSDPVRRYRDLARVLGLGDEPADADDRAPRRLADHLARFLEIHPYADPLQLALVNPDSGEFLGEALGSVLHAAPRDGVDEETEQPASASIDVTAYVLEDRQAGLNGLDPLRTRQNERRTRVPSDHLRPAFAATVRPISRFPKDEQELGIEPSAHAHVAVVADMSQPLIQAVPGSGDEDTARSLSVYGLIARFSGEMTSDAGAVRWRYRIATAVGRRLDGHPAGPRFGDLLVDVQAGYLGAVGRLLGRTDSATEPVLEVRLDRDRIDVLERLHRSSDWVVTVDRFFGVDYYDSPNDPALGDLARKHLIDYSPEFVEGLGHRMIVTTAWREEVAVILRRAMDELGFVAGDDSVSRMLHALKTVSGRLALQALSPASGGVAAVSLGAVMSWLQDRKRLANAMLVPVAVHPELFAPGGGTPGRPRARVCDLALVSTRRGIIEMSFVATASRRGPLGSINGEVDVMRAELRLTADSIRDRFFDAERIDAPLQRALLANVLRFYAGRAARYGLLDPAAETTFLTNLGQYERGGAELRPRFEGFVVSLEDSGQRPVIEDNLTVTVLTARDFDDDAVLVAEAGIVAPTKAGTIVPDPEAAAGAVDDTVQPAGVGPSDAQPIEIDASSDSQLQPGAGRIQAEDDPPAVLPRARTVRVAAGGRPLGGNAEALTALTRQVDGTGRSGGGGSRSIDDVVAGLAARAAERAAVQPPVKPPPDSGATDAATLAVRPDAPVRIVVGDALDGEVVWSPSVKGSPHLFVTGIPGQGKSYTLLRLLIELGRQGVPALVFDYHGQFGATGNGYLRVADPVVVDAAAGLPFSPFECSAESGATDWKATAQAVSEIFGYVCGLGDIQRDTLYTCIRDTYRSYGFGVDGAEEATEFPTLDDVLRAIEQAERQKRAHNLIARCRPLLEMDIFRPPRGERSDLLGALRRGLVVGFQRLSSETLQQAAGAFLLRKLYRDMFGWGTADRLRLVVVLDEAHRLARDVTLPLIMKEGRKFGVAVIVASQGLADFHPDVLGNAGAKVAFRANYPDSRKVAGYFRGREGQDLTARLESLTVGQAVVQMPEMGQALLTRMRPPEG